MHFKSFFQVNIQSFQDLKSSSGLLLPLKGLPSPFSCPRLCLGIERNMFSLIALGNWTDILLHLPLPKDVHPTCLCGLASILNSFYSGVSMNSLTHGLFILFDNQGGSLSPSEEAPCLHSDWYVRTPELWQWLTYNPWLGKSTQKPLLQAHFPFPDGYHSDRLVS